MLNLAPPQPRVRGGQRLKMACREQSTKLLSPSSSPSSLPHATPSLVPGQAVSEGLQGRIAA